VTHRGPCQPRPFCDSVILCNCTVTNLTWPGFLISGGGKGEDGAVKILPLSVSAGLGQEKNKALMQTGALHNFKNSFCNAAIRLLSLQNACAGSGCLNAGRLWPYWGNGAGGCCPGAGAEPGPPASRPHPSRIPPGSEGLMHGHRGTRKVFLCIKLRFAVPHVLFTVPSPRHFVHFPPLPGFSLWVLLSFSREACIAVPVTLHRHTSNAASPCQ